MSEERFALFVRGKGFALTFYNDMTNGNGDQFILFKPCKRFPNRDPFLFATREQAKRAAREFGIREGFEIWHGAAHPSSVPAIRANLERPRETCANCGAPNVPATIAPVCRKCYEAGEPSWSDLCP